VFALSPRFALAPSVLVVIGGLSAVLRWVITAQEPQLTLLAVVFLHETVSPRRWVGVLLICVGVLLVGQTRPRTTEAVVRSEVAA